MDGVIDFATEHEAETKYVRLKAKAITLLTEVYACQREVADKLGISDRTLRTWKKKPDFRAELEEARKENAAQTMTTVVGLSTKAARQLEAILDGDYGGTAKVQAARTILELTKSQLEAQEMEELKERLEAIEFRRRGGGVG